VYCQELRVGRGKSVDYFGGGITRTVVHHDQLPAIARHFFQYGTRFHANLFQAFRFIEKWNYHAEIQDHCDRDIFRVGDPVD
jgi:hypothetical protein